MNRLNAIDVFNGNSKIEFLYNYVRQRILERAYMGDKETKIEFRRDEYIDFEKVLDMLKDDGFYIECTLKPLVSGSFHVVGFNHNLYEYLISWDERSPAVKYRVDGEEYQKAHNSIVSN